MPDEHDKTPTDATGSAPGTDPGGDRLEQAADSAERTGRRALHEVIHNWIPLGIAMISVLAALMGWRASLADETATHNEELSRQDIVHQQELLIQDNDAVNQDVNTYGQFAQFSALAQSELADAGRVGGGAGAQLSLQGQTDLDIARYTGRQIRYLNYAFDPSNTSGNANLHSNGTLATGHAYAPALALDVAENLDNDLHGLAPAQLQATADHDRDMGVDLTGIAALFVAVIVLLTLGAIVTGPRKLWLASSGAILAVAGLILFVVVELT